MLWISRVGIVKLYQTKTAQPFFHLSFIIVDGKCVKSDVGCISVLA
jgi:hypothetical protein